MLYLYFADWIWPEFYLKNHPVPEGKHTPPCALWWNMHCLSETHAKCINKFHEKNVTFLNVTPDGA